MLLRLLLGLALWGLLRPCAFGQESIMPLQQNPPSVRWRQINAPEFRLVFPESYEAEAQRAANALNTLLHPAQAQPFGVIGRSLGKQPHRIQVLMQTHTTNSNGFVTLSPRRSEFFSMPPQDYLSLGTNDWIQQLAVHEMRHVVQFDRAKVGLSKLVYYLFGNNALMGVAGLAAPSWFWEGDAVGMETALSHSGRGRIPNFDALYRAQLLERGGFGYHKAMLRSFGHQVPNHYVLGYLFTTYLRRHYGPQVWAQVTRRSFSRSLLPFAFTNALKHETGKRVVQHYRDMNRELDSLWRKQQSELALPMGEVKTLPFARTHGGRDFTHFEYPHYLPNGRVLALRSGIGHIQELVVLDSASQKVQKIFTPGLLTESGMMSVAGNTVAWTEFRFDPRWRMRDYQVVQLLDLQSGQLRTLGHRSRYVGAALSPDAQQVAVIEVDEANRCALLLLNAATGREIRRFDNPDNDLLAMPRFAPNGRTLVTLRLRTGKGKTLSLCDLETGHSRDLLPFSHENIGSPTLHGGKVFYSSPYNGIDNIYALDLASGRRWQVSASRYGAYNPQIAANGSHLLFNDFGPEGLNVAEMKLDSTRWIPMEQVKVSDVAYWKPLAEQEQTPHLLDSLPRQVYPSKPYRATSGLLNVYSWSPLVNPNDPRQMEIALYSQNLLSTATATAGYQFNVAEGTSTFLGRVAYHGLFPIIEASATYGGRSAQETVNGRTSTYQWSETGASLGLRVPLLLTRSRFAQSMSLATSLSFRQVGNYANNLRERPSGQLFSLNYGAAYALALKRSTRDIVSKWGLRSRLSFSHTPLGGTFQSALLATEHQVFVPGLLRHHSFSLRGAFQWDGASNYRFGSPVLFTRGYAYRAHDRLLNASAEYRMPLLYPDLNIGPLFNLQRVKAMLFCDWGTGVTVPNRTFYTSFGLDLTFDFKLMRLPQLLFDMGVRIYRLPSFGTTQVELVVGQIGF